jgi:hypothetical protein
MAGQVLELLADRPRAYVMGCCGRRQVVDHWSVDRTVQGYEKLIEEIYARKCGKAAMSNDERQMTKECRMTKFK